jgi:hypothetical protein
VVDVGDDDDISNVGARDDGARIHSGYIKRCAADSECLTCVPRLWSTARMAPVSREFGR